MARPVARAFARLLACGAATLGSCLACERLLGLEHGELSPEDCHSCAGGATTTHGDAGDGAGGRPNGAGAPSSGADGGAASGRAGSSPMPATAGGTEGTGAGGESAGSSGISGNHGGTSDAGGTAGSSTGNPEGGEAGAAEPCVTKDAGELCDGMDNDCDGLIDLEDGLSLRGTPRAFSTERGQHIAPVFSPQSACFAAAWATQAESPADVDIAYSVVDLTGTEVASGSIDGGPFGINDVVIAEQDGVFALLWSDASGAYFQRLSADGSLLGARVTVASLTVGFVALAAVPNGGWVAFWQDYDLLARRISASDALGQVVTVTTSLDAAPMRATVSGGTILIAFENAFRSTGIALPSSLVGGDYINLGIGSTPNTAQISNVAIAADGNGFAVAGIRDGGLVFKMIDTRGTLRCGPITVAEGHLPADIAPSENGFVLIGDGVLADVDLDCRVRQRALAPTVAFPGEVRAAGAPGRGYLVVWGGNAFAPAAPIGWHPLGPRFCD